MGTNRRSFSPRSDVDDSSFQSKTPIAESLFSGRAVAPSLDRRRAARLHVRALNAEFASWVQTQLRDHPDELWEDGAREYVSHAYDILEDRARESNAPNVGTRSTENNKPLEANSKEAKSLPTFMNAAPNTSFGKTSVTAGSSSVQTPALGATVSSSPSWSFGLSGGSQALLKSSTLGFHTSSSSGISSNSKSSSPIESVSFSSSPGAWAISNSQKAPLTTTVSFVSSSSSGLFSNNQHASFGATPNFTTFGNAGAFSNHQTAFKFGNQSSAPLNNAKDNADDDNEPEQPSSPSLKRSEEKGIVVIHETKCKLYIKSTDPEDREPWKDKGTGQLFIKCEEGATKGSKESKPRIFIRNDVGRIMLNASLYPGIKTNLQKNAIVTIFHVSDGDNANAVARTFLIRTKNEEERNKLADTIRDHAPAA